MVLADKYNISVNVRKLTVARNKVENKTYHPNPHANFKYWILQGIGTSWHRNNGKITIKPYISTYDIFK